MLDYDNYYDDDHQHPFHNFDDYDGDEYDDDHDDLDDHDDKNFSQVTSLVANEGLIVCGLCNGTANVYSQVILLLLLCRVEFIARQACSMPTATADHRDAMNILGVRLWETYIIFGDDDVGIFQGGSRLLQVLDCHSLGGQVQVRSNFRCSFHFSHANMITLQDLAKIFYDKEKINFYHHS